MDSRTRTLFVRRHYEAITTLIRASWVSDINRREYAEAICEDFITLISKDNETFNAEMFRYECFKP